MCYLFKGTLIGDVYTLHILKCLYINSVLSIMVLSFYSFLPFVDTVLFSKSGLLKML